MEELHRLIQELEAKLAEVKAKVIEHIGAGGDTVHADSGDNGPPPPPPKDPK